MKTSSWNRLTSCPIARQEHTTHTDTHIGAHTSTHRHTHTDTCRPLCFGLFNSCLNTAASTILSKLSQITSLVRENSLIWEWKRRPLQRPARSPWAWPPAPICLCPGPLCAWAPSHSHSGPLAGPQTPVSSGPGALERPNLPEWSSLRHLGGLLLYWIQISVQTSSSLRKCHYSLPLYLIWNLH